MATESNDLPHLLVATPAYNGMVHTDYVHSLLSFRNAGIGFALVSVGGESLITRGRNTLLARFHQSPQYSHLLFLDGDVHLEGADLAKMVRADRDVIGAPVALKTVRDGKPVFNIGGRLGTENGLVRVERLGTAVMLLSRRAVTALVEDAIADGRVYRANPYAEGIGDTEEVYDVFRVGVRDGLYLSEDYWVCGVLRELGFEIHVDLTVRTRHHGVRGF